MAPSLDLDLVQQLGRDIHSHGNSINSVMSEEEVCPWTLFLTLTLTLLKGSLPYIPKVLPAVIHDPTTRARAVEILESEDFQNNIEKYFIQNVKTEIQGPMNRQIMQSTDAVNYMVQMIKMFASFMFPSSSTDSESTFDQPKSFDYAYEDDQQTSTLDQVVNFVQTMYNLYRKWCLSF